MTNLQKAKEIAEYINQPNGSNSLLECHQAAMAMAEWKDKQFAEERKELIAKANQAVTNSHENGAKFMKECLIEKTVEWLRQQDEMIGISFQEDFIERFKQAIKGE